MSARLLKDCTNAQQEKHHEKRRKTLAAERAVIKFLEKNNCKVINTKKYEPNKDYLDKAQDIVSKIENDLKDGGLKNQNPIA